jgi:hypothetical protein
MVDTYTIKCCYPFATKFNEVEISSNDLIYTEATTYYGKHTFVGLQCNNLENAELIKAKCIQVANLIREIDKLNKTK